MTCVVPGCTGPALPLHPMCSDHWGLVPPELRRALGPKCGRWRPVITAAWYGAALEALRQVLVLLWEGSVPSPPGHARAPSCTCPLCASAAAAAPRALARLLPSLCHPTPRESSP